MGLKQTTSSPTKLHPNPWNPNKMSDHVFNAERESIGRFGFIDPITVRKHPELDDAYQIIDGEHRWRVATELKLKSIPICVIDVSDVEAKKLTIILNETRGEADAVDLGTLLAEIQADDDNLMEALPYTESQLENLISLAELDIPDYEAGEEPVRVKVEDPNEEWHTINMRVPKLVQTVFEQARDAINDELDGNLHKDAEIANGQALEILCAHYLSK